MIFFSAGRNLSFVSWEKSYSLEDIKIYFFKISQTLSHILHLTWLLELSGCFDWICSPHSLSSPVLIVRPHRALRGQVTDNIQSLVLSRSIAPHSSIIRG